MERKVKPVKKVLSAQKDLLVRQAQRDLMDRKVPMVSQVR